MWMERLTDVHQIAAYLHRKVWLADEIARMRADDATVAVPLEVEQRQPTMTYPANARVWRAIINSSFVGITHTATRLDAVLRRGPPAVFAWVSRSTPSQAACRHTAARALLPRAHRCRP